MEEHYITVYTSDREVVSHFYDYSHGNGFIRAIGLQKPKKNEMIENEESKYCTLLYIENFKVLNIEYKIKTEALDRGRKEYSSKKKIITFDLECYKDENNAMIPYACAFHDGRKTYKYSLTDYKNCASIPS